MESDELCLNSDIAINNTCKIPDDNLFASWLPDL